MLNIGQTAYYLIFYLSIMFVAALGLALHFLEPAIGVAMISFVLGHGAGLNTPTPSTVLDAKRTEI